MGSGGGGGAGGGSVVKKHKSEVDMGMSLLDASKRGLLEVVRRRLREGADPNNADNTGYTPLYWAIDSGHVEVVRELLQKGADPNQAIDNGETPLHWASFGGHVEVVRELLAAGADPTKTDFNGLTSLQVAEQKGHDECASLLRSVLDPWSTDNHALFPPAFRAAVRAVLCVHNRRPEMVGDVEVWLHVLSFAGREWFSLAAPAANEE